MSTRESPVRPLAVGGVAGLIVGCLIGWLAIGWWLWPVAYVGDAYTYELNDAEKMEYVAAVADSHNLNRRIEIARQRFATWEPAEKISVLAQLFAEDQVQGKMQEAERVTDLAIGLQQAEGWSPALVGQVVSEVAAQYSQQGAVDKAQFVAFFAQELGAAAAAPPSVPVSTPTTSTPQAQLPIVGSVANLLRLCGALLLLLVAIVAVMFILRRTRSARRTKRTAADGEGVVGGPQPLLSKISNYNLGMDNFDESFSIETEDGTFLGECGMGISEALGEGTPRRIAAFEVWLFDKSDIRTVTKVLMSEFAYNDEGLRSKLLAKGEPVLATPGATFALETTSLIVKVRVVELEYGDGMPAFGYFNNLGVSLVADVKPGADVSGDMPIPPGLEGI